jgi:hypothetical protein
MMTVTIELEAETEAVVRARAAAQGLDIQEYLHLLIKQMGREEPPKRLSRKEFEREWALLSEGTQGLPSLSDEDLSREALYADHD